MDVVESFSISEVIKVNLSDIDPDPSQPRQEFDPLHLNQLKKSIAQKGILNPLVVEKLAGTKYLLIDGERRYRACTQLELKKVPVRVVQKLTNAERLILRFHLQENSKPWTVIEKAKAIKILVDEYRYATQDLADMLNLTENQVRHYMLLLVLTPATKEAIAQRRIPPTYADAIATVSALLKSKKLDKYRADLEEAIVNKVERGILKKRADVRALRQSIDLGGVLIIENIIKIKNYTAENALEHSKAGEVYAYKQLLTRNSWFQSGLNKGIENSLFLQVDRLGYKSLYNTLVKLEKFLKLVPEGNKD